MSRANPAVGSSTYGNGNLSRTQLRCKIGFDPETFNVIRDRALREKTSFAEQVRLLVEWGLEAQ